MRQIKDAKARLLISTFALALTASPALTLAGGALFPGVAFAKDGSSGSSGSGHDGSDGHDGGSGSGHDGSGGDPDGGSGGDGDHSGPGGGGNDDGAGHDANDDNRRDAAEHAGTGGAKVEAHGDDIEVVHASGIKEEIENGRFEMKDASGRTIVERRATRADIARLRAQLP
jgi:hypothetical protein